MHDVTSSQDHSAWVGRYTDQQMAICIVVGPYTHALLIRIHAHTRMRAHACSCLHVHIRTDARTRTRTRHPGIIHQYIVATVSSYIHLKEGSTYSMSDDRSRD